MPIICDVLGLGFALNMLLPPLVGVHYYCCASRVFNSRVFNKIDSDSDSAAFKYGFIMKMSWRVSLFTCVGCFVPLFFWLWATARMELPVALANNFCEERTKKGPNGTHYGFGTGPVAFRATGPRRQ